MILFPPSKLNLGLQIVAKRTDGYHNLQTVFYQFPLKDVLEIVHDPSLEVGVCQFKSSGLNIPEGENLCVKAYRLLHDDFKLPGISIHLHKVIPMGAGLGGGSSDAAYTLMMVNQIFDLKIPLHQLKDYALALGSDCPFFLEKEPQYAEGRGELLSPVDLNLKGKFLLIINPKIHVSTAAAFGKITPKPSVSCKWVVENEISAWKTDLLNDFELPVFDMYPELLEIKEKLYASGADYAAMSGSGSTMFGIFSKPTENTTWPSNYFVWQTVL